MVARIISGMVICMVLTFHQPLNAVAQQSGTKIPRIGYLGMTPRPSDEDFGQRLRELGYDDGRNVVIDFHWIERSGRTTVQEADDLVRSKPDIIVAVASAATQAVKNATSTIPIVFVDVGDPVAFGFVPSLAHPGGNLTGLSAGLLDIGTKALQMLKELVPSAEHIGIISNPDNLAVFRNAIEVAAPVVGVKVANYPVLNSEDLSRVFDTLAKTRPDGLYIGPDHRLFTQHERLVEFAAKYKLPAVYGLREYAQAGGLIAIGPNRVDMYQRAASYVDRILHGANPADLPVEQPTRFEVILNMRAAADLGLSVPMSVLAYVDQVIE
jgi:putative ABC transport system substrate-binding protein